MAREKCFLYSPPVAEAQ